MGPQKAPWRWTPALWRLPWLAEEVRTERISALLSACIKLYGTVDGSIDRHAWLLLGRNRWLDILRSKAPRDRWMDVAASEVFLLDTYLSC